MRRIRQDNPDLQASDEDIARAILIEDDPGSAR